MNSYLEKHRFCASQISAPVAPGIGIIAVIPCHNEPGMIETLNSLYECERTTCAAEVIIVVNSREYTGKEILAQNEKSILEVNEQIKIRGDENLKVHLIDAKNLPARHAGVGLARKIGMDEAVSRFEETKNHEGIIVCLDADCTVDKNYLVEIEKHFHANPKATGCSIYFEHPAAGSDFAREIYESIINYELFLRYNNRALSYCGFPYAFHTIGSCMAVRSSIYQKQGGMNRRKAGEDFYFLQKIFPLGNHALRQTSFTELNTTCVHPSPRESNRVPFGTGSAVRNIIVSGPAHYAVYNIQTYIELKKLFDTAARYYSEPVKKLFPSLPEPVKQFLSQNLFEEKLGEFKAHSASEKMFVKRFFNWFDGFMAVKYVHFARDNFYPQQEIREAAIRLLQLAGRKASSGISKEELLYEYRKWERALPF